jgi:hypothetical protein
MSRTLTFLADGPPDEGALLLHVAVALRERRLTPESFSLTKTDRPHQTVRLSLTLAAAHARWLPAVVERLNEIPGVHAIEVDKSAFPPRTTETVTAR